MISVVNWVAMHILFCLEYFPPHIGGVEQMMYDLTRGIVQKDHRVTVLTTRLPDTPEEEVMEGVRVVRIRCPRPIRLTFNLLAIPTLMKLAGDVDILHCSTFNGVFPAWLVSKLKGLTLVTTVHEIWLRLPFISPRIGWFMKRIYPLAQRFLLGRKAACWIPVSRYTRNVLRLTGISDNRIRQVYNPVAAEPPAGWNNEKRTEIRSHQGWDESFIFIYFGRPGIWRGVEYLIEAFHLLDAPEPSRLVLVLSREPAEGYRLCTRLAFGGKRASDIRIVSSLPRKELIETILSADCVVVPSLSEGFGLIAAEASVLGIPVIASDISSLPEVVGGRCLMIPPASPTHLSMAMKKALKGEWDLRPTMHFPLSNTIDGYLHLYEEVLK